MSNTEKRKFRAYATYDRVWNEVKMMVLREKSLTGNSRLTLNAFIDALVAEKSNAVFGESEKKPCHTFGCGKLTTKRNKVFTSVNYRDPYCEEHGGV